MPLKRSTRTRAALVLCMLGMGSSSALAHNVCTVKTTSDGFVALRDRPSSGSQMVVRMTPGDMVVIDKKGYELVASGNWWRASHYQGQVFPKPGDPEFRNVRRGWVNSRFIIDCG